VSLMCISDHCRKKRHFSSVPEGLMTSVETTAGQCSDTGPQWF
jgi:hypothetical protein